MPSFSQTFSSTGTWPCPPNFLPGSLIVMCWGEGGNGANGLNNSRGGAGGAGGEWSQDTPNATAGNNYSITIGTGGTGANTTFVGDNITVTAHFGPNGTTATSVSGGTGSTNAAHFDGGASGAGSSGTGNRGGGGGGGSAGSGSAGGAGGAGTTVAAGTAGTAGTGTNPGAAGGVGSTPSGGSPAAGSAPGGGGGGGHASLGQAGASGAAGQVIVFWQTFLPFPTAPQHHSVAIAATRFAQRSRQSADVSRTQLAIPWDPPRYLERAPAPVARIGRRGQAPTGWPVPVQPPYPPGSAERRWTKPPYPRRGITITPWPSRNVPTTESYRRDYKPPYPRRGVVPPTGWPISFQPTFAPVTGRRARIYRHVKPHRGSAPWPGTEAIKVQPPYSTWIYKLRWTKPLFPRKGVVAPSPKPFVQPTAAYNPASLRRSQKYQWFRRANVAPTGWPIPVQPPMTSQSLRRPQHYQWFRRAEVPPTRLPSPVPTSTSMRREQRYQWFRRGRAVPGSGLPVPVQPIELPHSVRRISRPLIPRKQGPRFSSFFIPVQPPERMQSMRRWSKPLWPRRGKTLIATLQGAQPIDGYQLLPLQTFSYTPGQPGIDLSTVGLSLFQLNKFGFTFFNRYGDVVLIVYNTTSLPASVQPIVIRTVEHQTVTIPPSTIGSGQMQVFGPFPYGDFTNPDLVHPATSYFMNVNVSVTDSGLFAGAFRMVSAPRIGHVGPFDRFLFMLRRLISQHHVNISSTPGEIHPGESTPGA